MNSSIHRLSIWHDWVLWLAPKKNNDQHHRIDWTWNVPTIKKNLFQEYSIFYFLYIIECLCDNKENLYKLLIGLCNKEIFPKLKYLVLEGIGFIHSIQYPRRYSWRNWSIRMVWSIEEDRSTLYSWCYYSYIIA